MKGYSFSMKHNGAAFILLAVVFFPLTLVLFFCRDANEMVYMYILRL